MTTATATERNGIERRYLRVPEVCAAYGLARSTLYGLMDRGDIPFAKFGRCRRIPVDAMESYARRNTFGG